MTDWLRLWHEMPADPKWRTIAKRSGQRIGDVIAVYMFMLVDASSSAPERGRLTAFDPEDVATALDLEQSAVAAIQDAMIGKVLDPSGLLTGWAKRQPKREDGAAERARAWRAERERTTSIGGVRSRSLEEIREDQINTDAIASGGEAPPCPPAADVRRAVFESGVPLLTGSGCSDRNARSMLGRWRQTYTDGAVLDVLAAAQAQAPSDPVAWINKALEKRNARTSRITRSSFRDPLLEQYAQGNDPELG